MGEVIGYKGTPEERRTIWKCMTNYRGSYELYKDSSDAWKKSIADRDRKFFNAHLDYYVRGSND